MQTKSLLMMAITIIVLLCLAESAKIHTKANLKRNPILCCCFYHFDNGDGVQYTWWQQTGQHWIEKGECNFAGCYFSREYKWRNYSNECTYRLGTAHGHKFKDPNYEFTTLANQK